MISAILGAVSASSAQSPICSRSPCKIGHFLASGDSNSGASMYDKSKSSEVAKSYLLNRVGVFGAGVSAQRCAENPVAVQKIVHKASQRVSRDPIVHPRRKN